MRTIRSLVFSLLVSTALLAAGQLFASVRTTSREVMDARAKTGELVTCSPFGKVPGTFTVEEAAKKLRPGMVLRLLPGKYNPLELVIFEQDRIIVESDNSGGYVDLPLILYGKNCIVRNISLRSLELDSGVEVDSKIHSITITSGNKRSSALIENCAANFLRFFANAQDITVRNSSVVVGVIVKDEGKVVQTFVYGTVFIGPYNIISFGKMERKGKVTFEKCVLFTESHLFDGPADSMKLVNLNLNDNLIWCARSLFEVPKDKPETKNIEGLDKYFAMGRDIKNILAKPSLKVVPSETWSYDMKPGIFIITSGPGSSREYGCNMTEGKGIPAPM